MQALWNMLNMFQTMFGPDFWRNAILEATHWSYSPRLGSFTSFRRRIIFYIISAQNVIRLKIGVQNALMASTPLWCVFHIS